MIFSKTFLIFLGRLSLAGIVVLGGFQFGFAFYMADVAKEPDKIEVRTLAEKINGESEVNLDIYIQGNKRTASYQTVNAWFDTYTRSYSGKEDIRISSERVGEYLASIAPFVNTRPVNAKFILVDGKAKEFIPSNYGLELDMDSSKNIIIEAIVSGKKEVNLPVNLIEPDITLNKINELGITALIGRGESNFSGSPASRIHNIKVGSAKYNGTILKPGEEFSFNSILGEVDEKSGYQPELVIKSGKLVYEYGGGICQVSTTLFRSAIMAGLPIIERKNHSFPVKYYAPQGYDSTVYPGVVDLKFRNDTPNHILIQSKVDGTKLIFDIYGSLNERKVALDGPFQYDQKANGSMKAYFIRKIYQGGLLAKEERFDSNYGAPAPLERNPLE
ncbi:MAG: VanW family protein [Patescibacteria group bacterium]